MTNTKSIISNLNSTTTALNDGQTFTGGWEDVTEYESVVVACKTDQDGILSVQFSPDGVNVDSTLTRYYRTGQIEPPHRFTITRKYYRITFENNSGSNQTELRIQTSIKSNSESLNSPLDAILAQDYDAIVTRPTDYHTEVALSLRQGATTWNKFGYNTDIDTGTEIIASWGGTFQFLTSGETIDIVSSSADDDDGGTGVNSVVIYGVDENWDEQIEVVTLNGTTTVTTTSQWIGINRVAVFLSGTGRTNAGTIDVTATTSGFQMAQMPPGGGVTQQLIFYVPRNHQFLAEWLFFSAVKTSGGSSPVLEFYGQVYSAVNNTIQEVFRSELDVAIGNNLEVSPPIPFPVGEKSILYFECDTNTANTKVTGRFSGELIRDKDA